MNAKMTHCAIPQAWKNYYSYTVLTVIMSVELLSSSVKFSSVIKSKWLIKISKR